MCRSKGYCATLEQLLKLSPPPQHPVPFKFATAQSILVTHYVDCQPMRATTSDDRGGEAGDSEYLPANGMPLWTLDKEDRPWPVEHAAFLDSVTAQQLLCLEIASGSSARHKPELLHLGKKPILMPGSLRERGEFCIVEMSLEEDLPAASSASSRGDTSAAGDGGSASPAGEKNKPWRTGTTSKPAPAACATSDRDRSFVWKLSKVDFHQVNRFRQH